MDIFSDSIKKDNFWLHNPISLPEFKIVEREMDTLQDGRLETLL